MAKVVLITGCSSGIGQNLSQRLSQAGYTVVATARNCETLTDIPAVLKLPLDVTQPDSIHAAVSQTIKTFGAIDVLANNAGYAVRGALEEIPVEQVQQMFDVNVFGVLRMIHAVVPHMRRQGSGRIINISSIAGKLSTPINGTYSATKFALEALSDALRIELAPFGIQVVITGSDQDTVRIHGTASYTIDPLQL
jgi:NADP-dependent 3-hydroxy acid dehydrogenase YdfG